PVAARPGAVCARATGLRAGAEAGGLLRSRAKRVILNCCRQWGKSTVTAAMAVHRAATQPGSLVLVASPSGRQSGEFLLKARPFVRMLGIELVGMGRIESRFCCLMDREWSGCREWN